MFSQCYKIPFLWKKDISDISQINLIQLALLLVWNAETYLQRIQNKGKFGEQS